jgi:hypothetical protein
VYNRFHNFVVNGLLLANPAAQCVISVGSPMREMNFFHQQRVNTYIRNIIFVAVGLHKLYA